MSRIWSPCSRSSCATTTVIDLTAPWSLKRRCRANQPRTAQSLRGRFSADSITRTRGRHDRCTFAALQRGMGARVIPHAEVNGYVIYGGAPKGLNEAERLAHNSAQIEAWMAEGRQIIDIGPGRSEERRVGKECRSR